MLSARLPFWCQGPSRPGRSNDRVPLPAAGPDTPPKRPIPTTLRLAPARGRDRLASSETATLGRLRISDRWSRTSCALPAASRAHSRPLCDVRRCFARPSPPPLLAVSASRKTRSPAKPRGISSCARCASILLSHPASPARRPHPFGTHDATFRGGVPKRAWPHALALNGPPARWGSPMSLSVLGHAAAPRARLHGGPARPPERGPLHP
jgi:hypothetical protein